MAVKFIGYFLTGSVGLFSDAAESVVNLVAALVGLGIEFHALRSRMAGSRRFVSFHVIVPRTWTVLKGHTICEERELAIRAALPECSVFTHLEPKEDPVTFQDMELDRAPLRS